VGKRIILFGGGARHTNHTSILDVCTKKSDTSFTSTVSASLGGTDLASIFSSDELTLRMIDVSSGSMRPHKRCSAASVVVGTHFLIMGGFSTERRYDYLPTCLVIIMIDLHSYDIIYLLLGMLSLVVMRTASSGMFGYGT